jgi:2,4-dienoyl-CoA reductase-like NADH-dependent reductase (Old Yellow Enzyme family)
MTSNSLPAFLRPGTIGRLKLKNRLVRAATSETMATAAGLSTEALVRLYGDLAKGGAGLIITGHIYVEPCGQYEPWQLGLHRDDCIAPLRIVTDEVHRHGGVIFAELSHAGSQSIIPEVQAIAPSIVPNTIWGRTPVEMTGADVERVIAAFGAAAARAMAAGFDGIHIHSANGYLLSQFNSPATNLRTDKWGARGAFVRAVYRAIRDAVGPDVPVTIRLGVTDMIDDGLTLDEGLAIATALESDGVDAIEVSYGMMSSYTQNIRPYTGVTKSRGLMDGMLAILFTPYVPEAYMRTNVRAARARLRLPLLMIGGLRSSEVMNDIITSGDADFLSLARPFVREPDLARKFAAGRRDSVTCVSCNICFKHEGIDPLKCWRTPAGILEHIVGFYLKPAMQRLFAAR